MKFLVPKSAYRIDEYSETNDTKVYTYYKASDYGDKVDVSVKTEVTEGDKNLSEVFPDLTEED